VIAGDGLYGFAVVDGATRLESDRGIDNEPLEIIESGGVGLVVSRIPMETVAQINVDSDDLTAVAEFAQRHDTVVSAIRRTAVAAIPLRLGTVLVDRAAALSFLREHEVELRKGLARVAGCDEWTVILRQESTARGEPVRKGSSRAPHPRNDTPSNGTEYLALRRNQLTMAERRHARTEQITAELEDAISGIVADSAQPVRMRKGLAFDRTYLVKGQRKEEFLDAIDHIARKLDRSSLALEVSGPWAAYSFATQIQVAGDG
jgi:hypothetical protein